MQKNLNIIKFYLYANKLKEKVRTGWIEIGIEKERLESVAEHIFGCLILAIAIDSEYRLDIDMYKVLKMLTLHELEEIIMGDLSIRSEMTREEKLKKGKEYVSIIVKDLYKKEEIENLLDEFNAHITKESKFCYHIDKIECDFQAKVYDLQGVFKIEKAMEDLEYYDNKDYVIENAKTASDYWILYDMPKFANDEIFETLVEDIRNIKEL